MNQFLIIMAIALGLSLVAIIAFVVMAVKRANEQKAAQRARALESLGLRPLEKEARPEALAWVSALKKLSGGAKNIVHAWSGESGGRTIEWVQHRYVVSTGQTTVVVQHRIVALSVPETWPGVHLAEENIFTRIGSAIVGEDLQLEDESFNKRWRIRTEDEAFTMLLLAPELQEVLRQAPRGQQWIIESDRLILMEKGEVRPEDVPRMTELLLEFRRLIPPELDSWQPDDADRFDAEDVNDVLRVDNDER